MREYQVMKSNTPLPKAGIYRIRNLVNGDCYIGSSRNVKRRISQHFTKIGVSPELIKAFAEFGKSAFIAEPLFYAICDGDIGDLETQLINESNSSYNVAQSASGHGKYGEKFSLRISDSLSGSTALAASIRARQTPDLINRRVEKQRATMASPEYKQKRSEASRLAMQSDAVRQKISASNKKTMSSYEFKRKRSDASRAMQCDAMTEKKRASILKAYENPEYKKKIADARRGKVWINNGKEMRCVHPDNIPSGWTRGRLKITCSH